MSSVKDFLNSLQESGIIIRKQGNKLEIKAPRETLTPELRQQLAKRKAEILSFLSHFDSASETLPVIQPASRNQVLPLSFAQERLWFLEQLTPDNAFYNSPLALRLLGVLDQAALQQSLNELVRRHETLRTTLSHDKGLSSVQIHPLPETGVPIEQVDLSATAQSEAELAQRVSNVAHQPFDLTQEPPLRVTLFKQAVDDHVLLLNIHHIATDGWSYGVLQRELGELYNAFVKGQPSPLQPLPIQYVDFTLWQRSRFTGDILEQQLQYWRDKLADVPTVLNLPTDYKRPPVHTYHGAVVGHQLSPALTEQLKRLSQQHEASLFMTTLAAFAVVMGCYTGQERFVIGSPIANRHYEELESLIGFFVNTLALPIDLRDQPSFRNVLQQVRQTTLDAYDHQDFPFERVVEALKLERDLSRNPLVQVMFAVQNAPMKPLQLSELTLAPVNFQMQAVRFDLEVHLWERESGLYCQVYYYQDLFDQATIERMLAHFEQVLQAVVADAEKPVNRYPLLTAPEIQQLQAWNQTQTDYPKNQTLVALFEQQVLKTPDTIAVVFDGKELSYRQLNDKANQLAHSLLSHPTLKQRHNPFIAIAMERSLDRVIGVLGILKAGGAYVPIDTKYPAKRIAYLLKDSAAPLLLTQSSLQAHCPVGGVAVLCLDTTDFSQQATDNPHSTSQAEDLAYVGYTSGSTGQPKGVCIPHRAVVRLVKQTHYLDFSAAQTFLQLAPLAFDASTLELWGSLLNGQRLVVMPPGQSTLSEIAHAIQTHHVTTLWLTAGLFHLMVDEHLEDLRSLKHLLAGGDVLSIDHVKQVLEQLPDCRLINGYGPTENTTFTACCTLSETPFNDLVPIGKPISNTRVYILDKACQPVPVGVAGELCTAGDGLARGYLNRPELTAEKFIEINIFGKPERVYRTGDLARWRPDGYLEFLGRIDSQVKLRGFRIELTEIEAVLAQHHLVEHSVVTCTETAHTQDKRLCAYVVPASLSTAAQSSDLVDESSKTFISQWEQLYNDTYGQASPETDLTFNLTGWHSSYTGTAIPAEEMGVWVDSTVAAIQALKPNAVLEIGCGTGLLLSRIAPQTQTYWGTDFSPVVLQQVEQLKQQRAELGHLVLKARPADDFSEIDARQFDTVVLNSVIQYFPSVDYLITVLEQAIESVKPGGQLFIGDIRHLPLLRTYHASVQAYQTSDDMTQTRLRQRVAQQQLNDKELVIDPRLFIALYQQHPRVTGVKIRPHRGLAHNELTRFRYQAILDIEHPASDATTEVEWQDWHQASLTFDQLCEQLEAQAKVFGLRGVPNARLESENAIVHWLDNAPATETVGELRQQIATSTGWEPEALWRKGEALGYDVDIGWHSASAQGHYDVLFKRRDDETAQQVHFPIPEVNFNGWHEYANNPLHGQLSEKLAPQLRDHLSEHLPEYMIPGSFVLLEALPLSPNGKIDRQALPDPESAAQPSMSEYVAPRTFEEKNLARIWAAVLGLERVGIHDNFFELGGHSLLATQVVSRIRETFKLELPLRELFNAPTIAQLSSQLLEAQKDQKRPPLVPQTRPSTLPLSFAQERLWFLEQLTPDNPFYNSPLALRLIGTLNQDALQQSLNELVRRHETLRTVFINQAGTANVEIRPLPETGIPIEHVDLSATEQSRADIENRVSQSAHQPFDLTQEPPIRVTLFKQQADDHILLLTLHHIVTDAWSYGVLQRELGALYNAFRQGKPSPLAPLPIQYIDFTLWQRSWFTGDALEEQLNYWQNKLANTPTILELPTDHKRPSVHRYRGAAISHQFSPQLTQQLKRFSQRHGTTLFMTTLAAFAVVIGRYTGQEQFIIGSPIANRHHQALESLIGFFVNSLALAIDLHEQPTFLELLQQVRQTTLDAYAHQDFPFERLVDTLKLERDMSRSPLVQVMFAVQNAPMEVLNLSELSLTPVSFGAQAVRFDIEVHLWEGDEGLTCHVLYYQDLFEPATIERMLAHFEQVLQGVVADVDKPVNHYSLLTAPEIQQLQAWNQTQTDYPKAQTITALFEQQVAKTPDQIAVVFEEEQFSYQQLNSKANQLAHYLLSSPALQNQRNPLIAIAMERSLEMVIGVLGILKAGGAYVAIDPKYPASRIAYLLKDSAAPLLLTQSHLQAHCAVGDTSLLCLDNTDFANQPTHNPASSTQDAEDLAYVGYTSGSTGEPKGVCIPHRAVVRLVKQTHYLDFSEAQTFLQLAPLPFDASTLELWGCLLNGKQLVVMPPEQNALSEIAQAIQTHRVTTLWLTAGLFHMMVDEHLEDLRGLKHLLAGGDVLSIDHVKQVLEQLPDCHLINGYGPTENTTFTACCTLSETQFNDSVPIGKPIANTRVYLLDKAFQPVPVGVAGELCAAGDGLAQGYLNRPELTAEKFIEVEVFGKRERVYRTGDLVRWRPDGYLEFLGRIDSQIKLRGFRIELGEIEAVLAQHEAVKEVAVILSHSHHDKRLVAYLTTPDNKQPEVRDWLKARLPDYMVPAHFQVLEALPLTANGKIDRQALEKRAAEDNLVVETANFVAPRTPEEELLANIWAEVLSVERVSIHDNFFELGGHSLLATKLMARIRETFQINLPLQQLFHAPSVAELTKQLQQGQEVPAVRLPIIVPAPDARHQPFPLNDIQQAYWLGRSEAFAMGNVAPHIYLELDCQHLDVPRLEQAWQRLIERHEMLRAIVLPDGQQQILPEIPHYQITVLDLSAHSSEATQAQLAEIRQSLCDKVFNVSQWPLFDIRVTQLNAETMRLHFSLDAIIHDGWSNAILSREWWLLYQDPRLTLEPLTLSFRDYLLAEQNWHQEASYQNALNYWRNRLETLPPAPQLPLARQPDSVDKPHFNARRFHLPIAQWQTLKQKGSQHAVTPSAMLLAIFADVLALWSKSAHFMLNLTLFNRLPVHQQINQLVGDFTSLILLEIDNRQSASFSERARQIQKQLWQDLEHRYVSGVQVMREMAAYHQDRTMPIVFSSMLALEIEQGESLFNNLGEPVFGLGLTPQVWIDHGAIEGPDGLELVWNTVDDLFPDGLLDDLFAAYQQHVLALTNTDSAWQAHSTQALLPATHLAVQQKANATAVQPAEHFMHTLFLEQVTQRLDQPAVISGETCLSYTKLHSAALQVAHWLHQQGVARNERVAVVMDKGWEQVVAVMGILYAGAAYVPIASELPEQRQHFLLQDTEARLVLTQHQWLEQLNWPQDLAILAVDQHDLPSYDHLPDVPERALTDLAYIIYTSGSTGQPKGVVIDHRGAVNTLLDINRRFQISAQDRVLALSALNFDLSVYDIFGVLAAGGTIILPEPAHRRDPQHWAVLMVKHQVTLWNTVPALMQMLVDYQNGEPLDTPLRLVMMSGDWIPLSLPERIKQLWADCQVISLGGATEASIWSIYYPIETVDHSQNSIPYGKPLTNQTFYVLNQRLESCPIWTPGQLYIGGIGLAQGYWKDDTKTQASFITHPDTQERLYKTGDLGRWLPDGNIEFLGREDAQVKVRGHRIELGEIETYLNRAPDLKEAVVIAVGEALQEKQLIAYIVPQHEAVLSSEADQTSLEETLKSFLSKHLPAYMVPHHYVILDRLPLTPNGKVERKALPISDFNQTAKSLEAPANETEQQLMEIVVSLLKPDAISVTDNFFDTGANSLDFVQIYHAIKKQWGIEVNIMELFQRANVREIADLLTQTDIEPDFEEGEL